MRFGRHQKYHVLRSEDLTVTRLCERRTGGGHDLPPF